MPRSHHEIRQALMRRDIHDAEFEEVGVVPMPRRARTTSRATPARRSRLPATMAALFSCAALAAVLISASDLLRHTPADGLQASVPANVVTDPDVEPLDRIVTGTVAGKLAPSGAVSESSVVAPAPTGRSIVWLGKPGEVSQTSSPSTVTLGED